MQAGKNVQISWHGQYTVRLQIKDFVAVLDPHSPAVAGTGFRGKADTVALTNPDDPTMSHVAGIQGDPVVLDTPGEYSVHGCQVRAVAWRAADGSERSLHRWTTEGMTIAHLGALERMLTDQELQDLQEIPIDILLVPLGGSNGFDVKHAVDIVTTIEPRIAIPIHFTDVKQFTQAMGVSSTKGEKKLTIRASALPQDDLQVVVLEP